MINLSVLITLLWALGGTSPPVKRDAYRLYTAEGKKTRYEKMVDAAASADVVLFGELHNNPIAHWMQLELTSDLFSRGERELVLGAEMFEADNQLIMDEYLSGLISEDKFEDEARLWNNYKTDYKPLVTFAKNHGLPFIATNIPRRYANTVYRRGTEALDRASEEAQRYMVPLPLEYDTTLSCYARLSDGGEMGGHGGGYLADAQAIKDATMAHFILNHLDEGRTFLHFNGAYHSDFYESIYWFLKKQRPGLEIVTISTVSQRELDTLEEEALGKADFILAVPSTMTTTY